MEGLPGVDEVQDGAFVVGPDERSHLREEIWGQQQEAQRLRMHMQGFEDRHLSQVVQDLKGAMGSSAGNGRLNEHVIRVLDELVHAHADTCSELEKRDQEWQQHLQDQLSQRQHDSDRLSAKSRAVERKGGGKKPVRSKLSAYESDPAAEQERVNRELRKRLNRVTTQFEEERVARKEQELACHRLAGALKESRSRQRLTRAREAAGSFDDLGVPSFPPSQAAAPDMPHNPSASMGAGDVAAAANGASSVRALRQDLEELRAQEQAQRAAVRRSRAGGPSISIPETDSVAGSVAASEGSTAEAEALRSALKHSELRCAVLERENADLGQQFQEVEVSALEVSQAEAEWRREAEDASWLLTEAANEVAFQADLEHLALLEAEVRVQRRLQAAQDQCLQVEARCQMLEAIASIAADEAAASIHRGSAGLR